MIGRDTLLDLMPHQGTMALLDEVVGFDATTLHARTRAHARADNPLRDAQGLRAVHLCEVGAQATAAHGGLLAREAGGRAAPGLLVSLRGVVLHVDRVDGFDGPLDVHAEQLMMAPGSWQYAFRILHGTRLLAEGRVAVMTPPDTHTEHGHG